MIYFTLLGTEHRWCEDPIESAPFIRAQARKAQGPYCFPPDSFFFFFFIDYPGIFGGLNMVKTLENLHTHWNPRQLGRR